MKFHDRNSALVRILERFPYWNKVIASLRSEGFSKTCRKIVYYLRQNRDLLRITNRRNYDQWLIAQRQDQRALSSNISLFNYQPLISLIMPVYNVEVEWLTRAVASVTGQIYPHWELCIVDDGSTRPETISYLNQINDPRIKVQFSNNNQGIAGASNRAVRMAEGDYAAFLDHDDVISEEALFEIVRTLNQTDADMVYSDEDRIDRQNRRKNPLLKPDWSPDLLRCQNYICHFTAIRKSLIDRIGGFRGGYEGAQDHDLFLRISEATGKIHHIPKVLYSWREIPTSAAGNPYAKPNAQNSAIQAVDDHLKRMYGPSAFADPTEYLFVCDARYPVRNRPLVSIIIPTKDQIVYLDACIQSIMKLSSYDRFEIIILDNLSEKPESKEWFNSIQKQFNNIRVIEARYPFCWSRLNNQGMEQAEGEVFIFLNNDTQVISNDWITRLSEQALRDDVGVVGPLLLFEDGSIQHAGVVIGLGGWADHVYKGMHPIHFGSPYISPMVKRNVLAVTGSCMAISKKTIEEIGTFNEKFLICGSDVEMGVRAHEAGLWNIYDPFVRLFHFESKSRNPQEIPDVDFQMSTLHYKHYRFKGGDPFYNTNLSLDTNAPTLDYNQ
jgi:O-antigen biosynthesis protein